MKRVYRLPPTDPLAEQLSLWEASGRRAGRPAGLVVN